MATMNISIPDEMKAFVEEQAAKGGFGTVSEYIRDLIRGVQQRQVERQRVDALLLAGLDSGPANPLTPVDWESIRQQVHKRHAARQERTHGSKDSECRGCGEIETAGRGHLPCCGAGIWYTGVWISDEVWPGPSRVLAAGPDATSVGCLTAAGTPWSSASNNHPMEQMDHRLEGRIPCTRRPQPSTSPRP